MATGSVPLLAVTGFITIAIGLVVLLQGYLSARGGNYKSHRKFMIYAVVILGLFLVQYIVRAVILGQETHFSGSEFIRNYVYLPILTIHISFAIITIVLISYHLRKSLAKEKFTGQDQVYFPKEYRSSHRLLGRITLVLWLFSYLGGIVIFLFLYTNLFV